MVGGYGRVGWWGKGKAGAVYGRQGRGRGGLGMVGWGR